MNNQRSSSGKPISAQSRRSARFSVDLGTPMIFCVIEAAVFLILLTALNLFFKNPGNESVITIITAVVPIFYLFSAGTLCLVCTVKAMKTKRAKHEAKQVETEIYDMFRYIIDVPYAVMDGNGRVMIINGALQDILGYRNAVSGINFSEFCSISYVAIIAAAKNRDEYLGETLYDMPRDISTSETPLTRLSDGRRYEVISYIFKIRGENYYFTVFRDVEDYLALAEHEEKERSVVAYIVLDNLQELTQYVRADYRSASVEAENLLKAWVEDMHGFIKEYENDKYVAVFSKQELDKQILNDFDIRNRIMDLKVGDNSFPITVSMGIAAIDGDLASKERAAFDALNIAINRGGNQIAMRREGEQNYVYFGGTHKIIENNTSIASRVAADILEKKVRESSGVLIMGHSTPDFDSIGSCVGMARFVMSVFEDAYGKKNHPPIHIVIDSSTESYAICYAQLETLNIYDDIFISKEAARDLVSTDTVLIICDVNNPQIYEAPELVETVPNIAVVDHHRLTKELPYSPFLQYVEATKSSASEIVSEILMRSRFADKLHKEEAEVLLSGIMLDTNNYTRNAGAQTFEITHYLYTRGAHTGVVREFFNETLEELLLTGEFESKARIYRDCIAITWLTVDRPSTPEDRVTASKVADKLLHIKGVQASFALVKMGNDVVISGRSKGTINVQLILERLKGGGHFDIAGAQVRNSSLTKTCELLKDAIDDYFEYDHRHNKTV